MENKNNLQKNEVLNDQDIPVVDADRLLDSLVIIILINGTLSLMAGARRQ